MKRYILKRLLLILPTFIGITMLTYLMVRLAPGDYTTLRAGLDGALKSGSIGKEIIDQERRIFGLDKHPVIGYIEWLGNVARLDFGISRKDGRPVLDRLADALPITLSLNLITIVIVYIISLPWGIVSAVSKDTYFDRLSSLFLFILYSLPSFWVGLLLILYLSSGEYLNLFPLGGIISDWAQDFPFIQKMANILWHLVLPVATLTYGSFAFLARYTRANMLEVINQQYITTARSKGLPEGKIIFVHAFKNSLIPLITLMAALLPGLLGGSVIVESIFSIPGMGMLAFESILTRDIPVIMAVAAFSAILTLLGIFISDLMYAAVDPRIRLESKI